VGHGSRLPSTVTQELNTTFKDRDALIDYCRAQFPEAAAIDGHVSDTVGGRAAGMVVLGQIDPGAYGKTRNQLDGAVTGLSPYLRCGCLSLAECRDAVLDKERGKEGYKLINELAWRDYYQRVLDELGDAVRDDLEDYKTGIPADGYADELPDDIADGETGIDSIDAMARELVETVRKNVKIDWTMRENVRAQLRVMVKRILRKHGYPPDKQEKATQTVLEQAALLSEDWAAV